MELQYPPKGKCNLKIGHCTKFCLHQDGHTTWKGSMASNSHVLVYHGPLQIATELGSGDRRLLSLWCIPMAIWKCISYWKRGISNIMLIFRGVPSLKLTAKAPENRPFTPKGKEKVFQPSISGANLLLIFRGVHLVVMVFHNSKPPPGWGEFHEATRLQSSNWKSEARCRTWLCTRSTLPPTPKKLKMTLEKSPSFYREIYIFK